MSTLIPSAKTNHWPMPLELESICTFWETGLYNKFRRKIFHIQIITPVVTVSAPDGIVCVPPTWKKCTQYFPKWLELGIRHKVLHLMIIIRSRCCSFWSVRMNEEDKYIPHPHPIFYDETGILYPRNITPSDRGRIGDTQSHCSMAINLYVTIVKVHLYWLKGMFPD